MAVISQQPTTTGVATQITPIQQPTTIRFNGKDYDFQTFYNNVIKNYDNYARQFGYGANKYRKDQKGLMEILGELQKGNGSVEPGQIVFNSPFGDQKGAFGRIRSNSRHYTNPAWMIINTLQNMQEYDPNAGKKKITENTIKQELQGRLSKVGNLKLGDNKKKAQLAAIDEIINKYTNGAPEGYVVDKNFELGEYLNKLGELRAAVDSERLDDDELAYFNLDMNNPIESKPEETKAESGVAAFIKDARKQFTEAELPDSVLINMYNKDILPNKIKAFYTQYGIQQPTTKQSSGGGSRRSGAPVNAGSTQKKSRQGSQAKTTTKKPNDLSARLAAAGVGVGDQIVLNNKQYEITSIDGNKKYHIQEVRGSNKSRNTKSFRNGGKANTFRKLRKYQKGKIIWKSDTLPDGTIIDSYDDDSSTNQQSGTSNNTSNNTSGNNTSNTKFFQDAANVGKVANGVGWWVPGPVGRIATVGGGLLETLADAVNPEVSWKNVGLDALNTMIAALGGKKRYNSVAKQKYIRNNEAYKKKYNGKNVSKKSQAQQEKDLEKLQEEYAALNNSATDYRVPGAITSGAYNSFRNYYLDDQYYPGQATDYDFGNFATDVQSVSPFLFGVGNGLFNSNGFGGLPAPGSTNWFRLPKVKMPKIKAPKFKGKGKANNPEAADKSKVTTPTEAPVDAEGLDASEGITLSTATGPLLVLGGAGLATNANAQNQQWVENQPPFLPGYHLEGDNGYDNLFRDTTGIARPGNQMGKDYVGKRVEWTDPNTGLRTGRYGYMKGFDFDKEGFFGPYYVDVNENFDLDSATNGRVLPVDLEEVVSTGRLHPLSIDIPDVTTLPDGTIVKHTNPGEIVQGRTDVAYDNPLARYGRKVKGQFLHPELFDVPPDPSIVYPAAGLTAAALLYGGPHIAKALPWILGTGGIKWIDPSGMGMQENNDKAEILQNLRQQSTYGGGGGR